MQCRHEWVKPGEYFCTNPPQYIILCQGCDSTALYQRGMGVFDVKQLSKNTFEELVDMYRTLLKRG